MTESMHTVRTQEAVSDVSLRERDADGAKLMKDDLFSRATEPAPPTLPSAAPSKPARIR